MTEIVHPRLHAIMNKFFPELCTIQQATETQDVANQPIENWSNLAGHVNLSCAISRPRGGERKTTHQIYSVATHTIALDGYYPAITEKMRAVVNGVAYDILLPERDPLSAITQLVCQVAL